MKVENGELVSARDLARTYATLMDQLASGEIEKVVVTKHGKMEAVLIPVDRYEALTGGKP